MRGQKNTKPYSFTPLHLPTPRATQQERSIELVLRYVERLLGHTLSLLDAAVLAALIKAVPEEGGEPCERDDSQADSGGSGNG